MRGSVTYPTSRCLLGYTTDQHLRHSCNLTTLGVRVRLLISWQEHVRQCYEVDVYVVQWSSSWLKVYRNNTWHWYAEKIYSSRVLKCKHMTLANDSKLKNIFPLHTKMQNLSSRVTQCATPNVIMWINFQLKQLLLIWIVSYRQSADMTICELYASIWSPSQIVY